MEFHLRIKEFTQRYANLAETRFLENFADPVLLVDLGGKARNPRDFQSYAMTTTASELTEWEGPGFRGGEEAFVAPLVKSSRNAFPSMITLGRSNNNDIVIPHPRVSKFHAFFKKDPSRGALAIWEAGSTYGTVVAGETLEQGSPLPVESKSSIVFGESVRATFLNPTDLYRYVKLEWPQ